MQDEVNKIVFNALADGREIWFPGVGSLVPEFRSAWRASARQLERPSRRIAFLLSEQRGVSVIDLIARAGACDVAAAEDIYSRWLDKARVEDGISIPGVGELNHRYFRLDSQLDAVLNPLGHDPLPLKRRYSRLPLYLGIALFVRRLSVTESGSTESGCGCRSWAILKAGGPSRCRGRFIRPGKNRERNSRSHRR